MIIFSYYQIQLVKKLNKLKQRNLKILRYLKTINSLSFLKISFNVIIQLFLRLFLSKLLNPLLSHNLKCQINILLIKFIWIIIFKPTTLSIKSTYLQQTLISKKEIISSMITSAVVKRTIIVKIFRFPYNH